MKVTQLAIAGAYGRDYKSGSKMLEDFESGKDFRIFTPGYPSYLSVRDLPALYKDGCSYLEFRYNRLEDLVIGRIMKKESGCHLEVNYLDDEDLKKPIIINLET
jgi:hypothetical protein